MVARHVVTLANSIVGVSVLAMPFCFKQCGIVLATLSLMVGAVMTRMVCYFLLKAAVMSRRRTYEMLAWSTFGQTGKFLVEISIIGFLIGTLIAFMVVIGDLGPEILSEMFPVENNSSLRTIIMTALSLFVALPLGLLRNIDSLSSVSTASVLFYLFLVIKIFSEGIGPLWSGEYLERIDFWRSGGVLQCIPIFSMALSCQTQVFGIYDALPEPSLQKMNEVVKRAVYTCTFFYFCVGFFGYIAFSQQNFGGNILLSFSPAWSTQLIKSMFLMSVVFSVPLVVFPCRASLHSLMFRSATTYHHVHDMSTNYIPDSRLKLLTITIVGVTLVIGIWIPNIELVLGLVGSTTGSVICIVFPSIMFVRVTSKNTTERLLAQFMFIVGVVLMFLTTYATLYAAEQTHLPEQLRVTDDLLLLKPIVRQDDVQLNSPISKLDDNKQSQIHHVEFEHKIPEKIISKDDRRGKVEVSSPKVNIRKESASPKVKVQNNSSKKPQLGDTGQQQVQPQGKDNNIQENPIKAELRNKVENEKVDKIVKTEEKPVIPAAGSSNVGNSNPMNIKADEIIPQQEPAEVKTNSKDKDPPPQPPESQPSVQVQSEDGKKEFVDKTVAEEFLKRLEEHQESQKKLLAEQKEILEELKQHHAQDVQEKIVKERQKDSEDNVENRGGGEEGMDSAKKPLQEGNEYNKNKDDSVQPVSAVGTADKIIQGQEKIIEKISENIEKENKNAQLLEKLEENLEGKLMDAQANPVKSNIPPGPEQKAPGDVKQPEKVPLQKEEVVVNSQNHQGTNHQAPKESPKESVISSMEKERGILVGSLSVGAKVGGPSDSNAKGQPIPDLKPAVSDKISNIENAAVPHSNTNQQDNLNQAKSPDTSNSNKISNAIKENDKEKEIKPEIKNDAAIPIAKAPSSAVPAKKIDPEKNPKEKVDREM